MINLNKLQNENGKILILSYDQGYEIGPDCLNAWNSDIINIFNLAVPSIFKGIVLQKGIGEIYSQHYHTAPRTKKPSELILKVNGHTGFAKNSMISPLNCSLDYAESLGVGGIGYTIYFGSDQEHEMIREASMVQEYCREKSIPFILWAYPKFSQHTEDELHPKNIAYTARLGLELGADIVKLKYPSFDDNISQDEQVFILKEIVNLANPIKAVFQGGKKVATEKFLENARTIQASGAAGMIVGRNIWGSEDPKAVANALSAIWQD